MITNVGGKTFAEYLTAIQNGNSQHIRIVFSSQNKTIDENHISIDGLKYQFYMNPAEDLTAGTAAMAQIDVDLLNKDGSLSSIDFTQECAVSLGVTIGNSVVYQQIGIFAGTQPDKTHDEVIHLTGYDRMRKFEVSAESFFDGEPEGRTLAQYYADICTYCEVTASAIPSHAVNTGRIYEIHPTNGAGYTCREILSYIAEAMGCYARISMSGNCELVWYTNHTSDYTVQQTDMFARDIAEYTVPAVDKLQVKVMENDVGVVVPQDGENNQNGYCIVNNPFLLASSDADLRPYVTNLYNKIHGYGTYIPTAVECDGTWLVEPGDIIRIQTGNSTYQSLPVFNIIITWRGSAVVALECTGNRQRTEITVSNRERMQIGSRFHEIINSIDELRSEIGSFSYGTNYVQWEDPRINYDIKIGDTWTKYRSNISIWGDLSPYTWGDVSDLTWGDTLGTVVYVWDGTQWIISSDERQIVYNSSMIDQTSEQIQLLVSEQIGMQEAIAQNTARIEMTANRIMLGVTAKGVITEESYIEIMRDHISLASGGSISIATGATFTVQSDNFVIDADGNVQMSGKITSAEGLIGGWEINPAWLWNSGTGTDGFTLVGVNSEVTDHRYGYIDHYFMYCGADYPDAPDPETSNNGHAPFKIVRNVAGYTAGTVESRYTCLGNQTYDFDQHGNMVCDGGHEGNLWVWASGTTNSGGTQVSAHGWQEVDLSALPFKNGWTWGSELDDGYPDA